MKKLSTALLCLVCANSFAQNKSYGMKSMMDTTTGSFCTPLGKKADTSIIFYYRKKGSKIWYPEYIHDRNIPIGDSYEYRYPKKDNN